MLRTAPNGLTSTRCAACHHYDHISMAQADGKRLGEAPCFYAMPTHPSGFCPCPKFRESANAEEFADSILGPVSPPLPEARCLCHHFLGRHPDEGQCLNFDECRCEEFVWDQKSPTPPGVTR